MGDGIWDGELLHCNGKKIAEGCLKVSVSLDGQLITTFGYFPVASAFPISSF